MEYAILYTCGENRLPGSLWGETMITHWKPMKHAKNVDKKWIKRHDTNCAARHLNEQPGRRASGRDEMSMLVVHEVTCEMAQWVNKVKKPGIRKSKNQTWVVARGTEIANAEREMSSVVIKTHTFLLPYSTARWALATESPHHTPHTPANPADNNLSRVSHAHKSPSIHNHKPLINPRTLPQLHQPPRGSIR